MHTVYKYPLGKHKMNWHDGPLCVAIQCDDIFVWVDVDTENVNESCEVEYVAIPTGGEVPEFCNYIGSVHGVQGWMVFHVYWRICE